MEEIARVIADFYNVPYNSLFEGLRGDGNVAIAKQVSIYLMTKYLDERVMDIAAFLKRDKSLMSHSRRKIASEIQVNKYRRREVENIKFLLGYETDFSIEYCIETTFKISKYEQNK